MTDPKKPQILVVDDEESIREVLQRSLESEGYDCTTASNANEAFGKIGEYSIDLVLTDITMPGETGVDLLKKLRLFNPDTAVIMVTAVADTQTAIEAMKMGASDYVTKPFNLAEVTLSVERALEKRSLLIANREYRDHLEQKVKVQTDEIRSTFLGALTSLAEALDAKDKYTNGHSKRVTEVAVTLAREMGLPEADLERIRLAGFVHDIGKIGVAEDLLHKCGKLTDEEFDRIKEHPEIGEKILRPIIHDPEVIAIVRHHHERFSGGGYPEGLAGEDIPLGSRLLAVADAYDAMTSTRPYRRAMSPEEARSQIMANRGKQFDPEIVDLFIRFEDKLPYCPMTAGPSKKEE